ncbi:MAG: hypothetical protein ABI835_03090 [Chloroflexota bacterium]
MDEIASAYLGMQCLIVCIGLLFVLSGLFASDKTLRSGNLGSQPEYFGMTAWRRYLVVIGIAFFVVAALFPSLVKF